MSSDPPIDDGPSSLCDYYAQLAMEACKEWDGQDTTDLIHAIYAATGEKDLLRELDQIKACVPSLHQRRCRDCGEVSWHADHVTPYVLCPHCGSQDTRWLRR